MNRRVRLRVRTVTETERQVHEVVFDRLSAASRLSRYHAPVRRLSSAMVDRLADVDGFRHVAVVAEIRRWGRYEPVGLGRYVATEPGRAELALEVADDWQRHGIGRLLVEALRDLAREHGIGELYGHVLADNLPVRILMAEVFERVEEAPEGDGSVLLRCRLDAPVTVLTGHAP